jgi:hypothetical protein
MSMTAGFEMAPASTLISTSNVLADVQHAPDRRAILRKEIRQAREMLGRLPAAEQQRLYEESRAKSTTLFALLHRLQDDPAMRPLVHSAVEQTRLAPADSELSRASGRAFAAAFRAGDTGFRKAVEFVLRRLCEEFGETNARRRKLADLQRGYLAAAARAKVGEFESAAGVMKIATVGELWNFSIEAPAEAASTVKGAMVPAASEPASAGEHLLVTSLVAACLNLEAGVRNFAEFTEAMAADLGEAVRPYLRVFYEAIRHYPGIDLSGRKVAAQPEEGFLLAA